MGVMGRNRYPANFVLCMLAIVAFIGLALLPGEALAAENNVHLHGALVAEPCIIPPGEEEIALDFGAIVDKYIYRNTRTPGQVLSIHLTQCDLSLGKTVSVTLTGIESRALPGLLAIDTGSGATGVVIGLETLEGKPVPLNQEMEKINLKTGSNEIVLQAFIQGEPAAITSQNITLGPFTATTTFSVNYE
ncbi:fimbrial protein [Enterobacter wuhouensis]|uniref:fimbrial protein n=1 Tax=Enterobacter wuhouensis TaxID=2529381 RepID=UPI002FCECA34